MEETLEDRLEALAEVTGDAEIHNLHELLLAAWQNLTSEQQAQVLRNNPPDLDFQF
jgi:hypothetical protein